jgi:hypothetical protein
MGSLTTCILPKQSQTLDLRNWPSEKNSGFLIHGGFIMIKQENHHHPSKSTLW